MGKKSKNKRIDVVYSTNDNYDFEDDFIEQTSISKSEQLLTVHLEKKGRGGKTVVIIRGFIGNEDDLVELSKLLKKKCGTGGSAKDGEIIIQGDNRPKVIETLNKEGYNTKSVGG